jgi:hypothetical protein
MAKTLNYGGHPGELMTIRKMREDMGCASREDGDTLLIRTFGEWDSRIEGGAYITLVVVVPNGVEVEQRKGLSGPKNAGGAAARIPALPDPERRMAPN